MFLKNINNKKFLIILFIVSIFFVSKNSFAASDPAQNAGKILNQEQELEKQKKIPKEIPKSLIDKKSDKKKSGSEVKILVKEFKFEGDIKLVSKDILKNLVKDYVGKSLTFDEIQSVLEVINSYYAEKGYFLASAILPKQEVKDGVIIILVNEGKLDSKQPYEIKSLNLRIKESIIKEYLNSGIEKSLNQQSLERSILNINDNPRLKASVTLQPGNEPESSKIILNVTEGKLLDGSLSADNYGSRYTGENRVTFNGSINDPLNYGDQVNFIYTKAAEGDYDYKKISYLFPIGTDGLRLNAGLSKLDYKIGKELYSSHNTGNAEVRSIDAQYPIYRTSQDSIFFNAGYQAQYLYNNSISGVISDKKVDNYTLGLNLQKIDQLFGGGFTQIQPSITFGDLDLSKVPGSLTSDQSGPKTNGSFSKSTLQIVRIQKITDQLNLNFNADGQLSDKNLDSSQKLSLGGSSGVRAYPSGEASGDAGYKYSIDAKYNIDQNYLNTFSNLSASVFYDYGMIRQYYNTSNVTMTTPNHYSLSGYGVGFGGTAYKALDLKLMYAHTLGSNQGATSGKNSDGTADQYRLLLLVNTSF
jgi:hemolysin activation/secretion protein